MLGATGPTQVGSATPYNQSQQIYQQIMQQQHKWMFNGEYVSFKQFVELTYPNDTAEKTAFILKYSKDL